MFYTVSLEVWLGIPKPSLYMKSKAYFLKNSNIMAFRNATVIAEIFIRTQKY